MQPYANSTQSFFAEFPQQLKSLSLEFNDNHIKLDEDGKINIPDDIGHGMKINLNALEKYKVDVEIFVNKEKIF